MAESKIGAAKDAAFKLDEQAKWMSYLLRRYAATLERFGVETYSAVTNGGFYDELIEQFARILTADVDGRSTETFAEGLARGRAKTDATQARTTVPVSPAETIDSLLPA